MASSVKHIISKLREIFMTAFSTPRRAARHFLTAGFVVTSSLFITTGAALPATEAEIFNGPRIAIPVDAQEGFRKLIETLKAAGMDADSINAARKFVDFVENNPDLIGSEIPSLSKDEQAAYKAGLSEGTTALTAIEGISTILASQDWLKEVDPELAAQIKEQCARRSLGGRDMYAAANQILRDPQNFDGDPVNLMEDVSGVAKECIENLAVYSRVAAQELNRLENFIKLKKEELEQAKKDGDQNAIDRIEAEIAAAEERKEEIKQSLDLAAVLEVLMGVASLAAGIAAIVATGGACVPCYAKVASGAAAIVDGVDKLTEDPPERPVNVEARRPGVNPDGAPSPEEFEQEKIKIDQDPNLEVIEPETSGGNFVIAKDKNNGNIVITQLRPELQITLELSKTISAPLSDTNLLPLDKLGDVAWSQVTQPLIVEPSMLHVLLKGTIGGTPVKVSFNQKPVDKPVAVTVEAD